MRGLLLGLLLAMISAAAWAADKPVYGPPPAWVKAAPAPKAATPDTAAIRLISRDVQSRYASDGEEVFTETMRQVQTPQGLGAAGSVTVQWRPETDVLTIHKVHIVRAGQVIDVLGRGQSFTVLRRETDLERAMLDGTLTATLQPEGLQVGDIIDFAMTLKRSDPVLKGVTGNVVPAATYGVPLDRLRIRSLWPKDMPVRWRALDGTPPVKMGEVGGEVEFLVEASDLQPLKRPRGAPARYQQQLGAIEFSRLKSWSEASAVMASLYVKAATLRPDSPIRQEAARIRERSRDPKVQAEEALRLVQDKVRYLFLGMNNGGYVPTDADTTWTRLFGDCKAKTALLLALLGELGIEAEPAFVSTTNGDGMDQRLPLLEIFDHVLVRARIDGKTYWLDGTRTGDRALDRIRTPSFHWALPVRAAGAELERLVVAAPDKPISETIVRIDASKGLDALAEVRAETIARGDGATFSRTMFENQTAANRDQLLRTIWKGQFEWAELRKVDATFDEASGEIRMTAEGTATIPWRGVPATPSRQYVPRASFIGWRADFDRTGDLQPDAPFSVVYPLFTRAVETVILPYEGKGFTVQGDAVENTLAGYALTRKATIENGVFTLETTRRAVAPEIAAADARAAVAELRRLAEGGMSVRTPFTYRPTEADAAQLRKTSPTTSPELLARATRLINVDRNAALADLDEAIKLDPKLAPAFGARAWIKAGANDAAGAQADIQAALALDPRQVRALGAQAVVERRSRDFDKAVETYTRIIEINSTETFAFDGRARAYAEKRDFPRALRDAEEVARRDPTAAAPRILLARIHQATRSYDRALGELDTVLKAEPTNAEANTLRTAVLAQSGRTAETTAIIDKAIAEKPTAQLHMQRAVLLLVRDPKQGLSDLEQAMKLDPSSPRPYAMRAIYHGQKRDFAAQMRDIDAGLKLAPQDVQLLAMRTAALASAGRPDEALADSHAALRAKPNDPVLLNSRCWTRAILNRELEDALADCDAALALQPNGAAMLDSRALVKLRLGRHGEAIADYDAALRQSPRMAPSLFGRGVAKLRSGARNEGRADMAAAKRIDAGIEKEFAGYGLTP